MAHWKRTGAVMCAVFAAAGCTYQSAVDVSPALDVYSSYNEQVPGRWALTIHTDEFAEQMAETEGFSCSAHKFPVDSASAFTQSVVATLENLVEEVHGLDNALPGDALTRSGYAGQIVVKAEDYDADLRVLPGFWTNDIKADVDMSASILVDGRGERLLGRTVRGEGEHTTGSGSYCSGGSTAAGVATEEAMEDLLQALGEAFSNAPKIRGYVF